MARITLTESQLWTVINGLRCASNVLTMDAETTLADGQTTQARAMIESAAAYMALAEALEEQA